MTMISHSPFLVLVAFLVAAVATPCYAQAQQQGQQQPQQQQQKQKKDPTLIFAEYLPGFLNVFERDMWLSKGLTSRVLATAGEPVVYSNGGSSGSTALFHGAPDGAAVFPVVVAEEDDANPTNPGGYLYLSNSELDDHQGGVGALTFDAHGNLLEYKMVLTGTSRNCNGGKTAWNTWVSCEEVEGGKCWQVDPTGHRPSEPIAHGSQGGYWETFAHDIRNPNQLYQFLTEDTEDGALQRMTIDNPDYTGDAWSILLEHGPVDYLHIVPDTNWLGLVELDKGTFSWTTSEAKGRANAAEYYPNAEGLEMVGNELLLISKTQYGFLRLNLDAMTYVYLDSGFHGQPDQLTTVVEMDGSPLTYFTEEASPINGILGEQVGIHTLSSSTGEWTAILEAYDYSSEITGIAFSPDGTRLIFAFQRDGILMELRRTDGLSFHDRKAASGGNGNGSDDDDDDCFLWLFCGFDDDAA